MFVCTRVYIFMCERVCMCLCVFVCVMTSPYFVAAVLSILLEGFPPLRIVSHAILFLLLSCT